MNEEEYSEGIWGDSTATPLYRLDFKIGDRSWFTIPKEQVESFSIEPAATGTLPDLVDRAPAGREIEQVCDRIKTMLLEKNISYGNSFQKPINIFSELPPEEQVKIRIDDKLNRLANGSEYPGDDTIKDLIGYLILLLVLKNNK